MIIPIIYIPFTFIIFHHNTIIKKLVFRNLRRSKIGKIEVPLKNEYFISIAHI